LSLRAKLIQPTAALQNKTALFGTLFPVASVTIQVALSPLCRAKMSSLLLHGNKSFFFHLNPIPNPHLISDQRLNTY
jgi:hypothetical protein